MRITSVIIALTLISTGLINAQKPATTKLSENPVYKEGIDALTDHLPGIATKKFTTLLESKSLSEQDKIALLFLLTESQIRSINPNKALLTLNDPSLVDHPDTIFWKGQALATAGRYNDAIQMLELAKPGTKYYQLAQFKIANLAATLNDTDKALTILNQSIKNTKNVSPQTYLSLASLYLAKNDPQNATLALEKTTIQDEPTSTAQLIIQAQIDILQESFPKAITPLSELLKESEYLDLKTHSYATLYLAEALHLNGQNQEAIDTLIIFLDEKPNTPLAGSMFSRLGKWIPRDTPITDNTITQLTTWANKYQTSPNNHLTIESEEKSDFNAFALYYYSRHLANQDEASSKQQAIWKLNTLRFRYPAHILAGTSLTDTATTQLALGRIEDAKITLKQIQKLNIPIAPIAKQQAGFLLGKLNLDEKNYQAAAAAFQTVIDSASGELRTASIINAASSYLASADIEGFSQLQQKIDDSAIHKNLTIEYALWLANQNNIVARSIFHEFIMRFPDHTRSNEVRMALALHCLQVSPIDLNLCQSVIPYISKSNLKEEQQDDYSYLLYRNAVAQNDYDNAADIIRQFTENHPEHPRKPEFTLMLGQALYHNGQHNEARRILLNLVKNHPQHPLNNYAEYYAGMSAKLEGTPQSQDEAILHFKNVISEKSSLSTEALLQLAQLHIDKNQPEKAVAELKPVFDAQPKDKKMLNIGILLASAYHAQGDTKPECFQLAQNIYDQLIKQNQEDLQSLNETKYYKALALQHMGNDDPALEIYYSVINIDLNKTPITEWKWYYKCGFNAIKMLDEMKNPRAAIAIAKKLASSDGNRSEEATKRARTLEMKYMIWEK